jgi:hypothetical protein
MKSQKSGFLFLATLFVMLDWSAYGKPREPKVVPTAAGVVTRDKMLDEVKALPAFRELEGHNAGSAHLKIRDFVLGPNENRILSDGTPPLLLVGFLVIDDSPLFLISSAPPRKAIWNDPQGGARITLGFEAASNSVRETDETFFGGTTRFKVHVFWVYK